MPQVAQRAWPCSRVAGILKNEESYVDLEYAVRADQVCIAMDMSSERGGEPVKLPLIEG